MNYQDYYNATFQLQGSNGKSVTCYLSDRDGIVMRSLTLPNNNYYYNYDKEELDYYICNYVNREFAPLSTLDLIGYSFGIDDDMYYVSTNKVDFYSFASFNTGFNVSACIVNDGIENANYDDYYMIDFYSTITSDGVFSVGTNTSDFDYYINENRFTIFDYSSLVYETGDYKHDVNVIRGENVSIYNVYFHIANFSSDNVYISYGNPYSDYYNQGYQTGYGNGSASGYVTGYDNGYTAGVNSGGNAVSGKEANAFNYIGQAFGVASSIMSLEVLPNVTLGLCFTIPLVFVLIMTIFKLVRK